MGSLNSQSSQFVFLLPYNFIPPEISKKYGKLLEKNMSGYDTILDFLNSTIKTVQMPGLSFNLSEQILQRGKKRYYKPATNVQDIVTSNEINIVCQSKESQLNYWIFRDILLYHYLDVDNLYLEPFTIHILDKVRDEIFTLKHYEIIYKSISDFNLNYSDQKVGPTEFTLTFNFNFYDITFELDKSKVLEIDVTGPKIVNLK